MIGTKDKRQITAMFCCTIQGDFIPVRLLYKGKTRSYHPKYKFPAGWNITHAPKHWSNEQTMVQYLINIYVKSVREQRQDSNAAALVIMDNFKGQFTNAIHLLLEQNVILVALLPMDLLQPLDITVNKPAKSYLRQKFED